MTPEDSAHDKELLERYKRASDTEAAAPSDAVRAAIIAEGRRVVEQRAKSASQQPFDVSRRAANDSRWKITAFGTAGAALVAALLFAPHLRENARRPALQTSSAPVAASNAPSAPPASAPPANAPESNDERVELTASAKAAPKAAPKAESLKPVQQDRQASLAELAPAEQSQAEKKSAQALAGPSPSAAAGAPTAGYAQSDVSANRARSARAKAEEPSGLPLAVSSGDTLKIQTLMDQGAALNERDQLGRTPLMLAVIDGRRDVVRLLLDRGADPNAADHSGRTPLQMARKANLREIAALLERSGAHEGK
jgi:Meckel syndrome type 1 protein